MRGHIPDNGVPRPAPLESPPYALTSQAAERVLRSLTKRRAAFAKQHKHLMGCLTMDDIFFEMCAEGFDRERLGEFLDTLLLEAIYSESLSIAADLAAMVVKEFVGLRTHVLRYLQHLDANNMALEALRSRFE